jgi:uncharacterized protein (DUF2235 family)
VDLRPGKEPLANLARALPQAGLARPVDAKELLGTSASLSTIVREARADGRLKAQDNFLVLVDQFEDMLRDDGSGNERPRTDRDEKAHFVAVILEAVRARSEGIFVVITVRAEFLGDCARFRDLPEAINRSQYLVPRMTRLQRRAAIEGPVEVAGAVIAPRLVQRILNDLGDDPSQLPVLQHALRRTWEYWVQRDQAGAPIDLEDYTAIGTLERALDIHANEALQEATRLLGLGAESGEDLIKRIFQRLRTREPKGTERRDPATVLDLCAVTGAELESVKIAIDCFRDDGVGWTFLTPFKSEVPELASDTLIDLIHEALFDRWKKLRTWADEEEDARSSYLRLAARAKESGADQNPLRGSLLRRYILWWKEQRPNAAWASRYDPAFADTEAYLSTSRARTKEESRRILLCLDGPGRDTDVDVLKPTNVLKLCRAVAPWDERTGRDQIAYYDMGEGSLTRYPGLSNTILSMFGGTLGLAFGAGFESAIERALNFLTLNYREDDEVFLFGFGRGAAMARGITHFLDWAGGLPQKEKAHYLPVLFREFVLSRGRANLEDVLNAINSRLLAEGGSALGPLQPIEVRFLGVWDSTAPIGPRFKETRGSVSDGSKSFYVDNLPARCVRIARQALAVDEARFDFRPEVWTSAHEHQSLEQRWFAGVHANVGGGYLFDGLANVAFQWILSEAQEQGLVVDLQIVGFYRGFVFDRLYRSDFLFYRIAEMLQRGRYGQGRRVLTGWPETANLTLDVSVIKRMQADPKEIRKDGYLAHPRLVLYRPENVLAFLACQPDLDRYLEGLGLAPEDRQLPEDVIRRISELRKDRAK